MSDPHFSVNELADIEFLQIQARRVMALAHTEIDPNSQKYKQVLEDSAAAVPVEERRLVGLALSGGGIRSATFGLGVLQGLAELGLLKFVDYLSTVSGGGYIGGWLAAWIKREGSFDNVEKQLQPIRADQAAAKWRGFDDAPPRVDRWVIREDEPEPIAHLREYGNYLALRVSLMSSDGWALIAIYLRNLVANQLVLLPTMLAVLLFVRLLAAFGAMRWNLNVGNWIGITALVMMAVGFFFFTWGLFLVNNPKAARTTNPEAGLRCLFATLTLVALACFLLTGVLVPNPDGRPRFSAGDWLAPLAASGTQSNSAVNLLLAFALVWGAFHAFFSFFVDFSWYFWKRVLAGFVAGAVAGLLLYLAIFELMRRFALDAPAAMTVMPPLFFLAFSLANIVYISLLGRLAAEEEREWRSRFNAWTMIVATAWISIVGTALYGGTVIRYLLAWKGWPAAAAAVTWLTTVIGGLRAAASSKTKGDNGGWLGFFIRVTPFVFLAGIALVLAAAAEWIAQSVHSPDWQWLVTTLLACITVSFVASWCVDVNEFSLNAMYSSRLIRCYLGASRRKPPPDSLRTTPAHCHGPEWDPNQVTGFDPRDDIDLCDLNIGGSETKADDQQNPERDPKELNYWGPFPLINTALNLVAGDRLAWQERKAESYVLSPLFCGCKDLGYRKADKYAAGYDKERPLTLGRSVAISGAAANPNMGYYSSPAVAALMTVFNVRLGWWLPNPGVACGLGKRTWESRGPEFLLKWLAVELASATNDKRNYLNISDGGHFDNLGVYELVRRRCRLIIVSDAGADPTYQCAELGMVIEKCRTDFGIDIEIDTGQLKPMPGGTSKWHCAIGTIRYDYVNPRAPVGTLVYIKPSLTGDESADVQNYAAAHPDFPQQSTLNQFYGESQFESYRQLGYHCLTEVMGNVAKRLKGRQVIDPHIDAKEKEFSDVLDKVREAHVELAENLVYHLRTQWLAPAPELHDDFLESVENFKQLQCDLRDNDKLNSISHDLYPDLPWDAAWNNAPAIRPADVHSSSLMLQIMENAYIAADLEKQSAHPLNAGWMNLFHRWSQTYLLRRFWPLLRNEYSRPFVFFCERELAIKTEPRKRPEDLNPLKDLIEKDATCWGRVVAEFNREWPKEKERHGGLDGLLENAVEYQDETGKMTKAAWYLRVKAPQDTLDKHDPVKDGFVAGIVAVRELPRKLKLAQDELDELKSKLDAKPAEIRNAAAAGAGNAPAVGPDSAHMKIARCDVEEAFWELDSNPQRQVGENIPELAALVDPTVLADLNCRRCFELVLWVRPGFRHLRVGTFLLETFLLNKLEFDSVGGQALRKELGDGDPSGFKLAVFYPRSGWTTTDDKFAEVAKMWLTFYSFYGFRRPGRDWPCSMNDEVLVWDASKY